MLRTVFNASKGFYTPKKEQWVSSTEASNTPVICNGFDQLEWEEEDEGSDAETRDAGLGCTFEVTSDMNSTSIEVDPSDVPETKTAKKPKKLTKEERKRLRQKKRKSKPKAKKASTNVGGFVSGNDAAKILTLDKIYDQIHRKYPKSDDKILQFEGVSIYKDDVSNLRDDEWLNDNDISFVYELLEAYQLTKLSRKMARRAYGKPANPHTILLLRPSMVFLLAQSRGDEVASLKGVLPPLEKADFIFLPVNDNSDPELVEGGSHWSLIVISILDDKAFVIDTLDAANHREARHIVKQVGYYLGNPSIDIEELKVPQQINGSDCGILVSQISAILAGKLVNAKDDHTIDFTMKQYGISAIDGRIWVMGTLLNMINKRSS